MSETWGTESRNQYSPFEFYVSSKDHQGHSTAYRVKIPDYLVPRLTKLKEEIAAYRTLQDVVRDALRHRIEFLEENFEEVAKSEDQAMFNDLDRAKIIASKLNAMKELPLQVRSICRALKEAKDTEALEDYLATQAESALSYREPWRSRILEVLSEYGDIIKPKPKGNRRVNIQIEGISP